MPRFIRGIESSTSRTPTGRRRKTHASSISNSLASPAVDPPLRPPSSTSNPYSNNMMNHSASLNVSHNQHIHRTRSNTQQAEAAFTLSSMAAQHTNMAWTSTARRDNDRNSTYSPECHQRTVSELVYPTGAAAGGTCSVRKNPGLGNVSASRMVELDIVVKSLNEQNADLASKVESANAKNADLASKLESAHASMNDMDMKLAVEKQAHNEAVIKCSKLEKVASRIVDLDDKVKSLNEQNADLASKLESANTSMNGMSKSLSFEKQAHSEAVIKCSKLEKAASQIVDLDDKVKSLNERNADLASKLESANTSMNGMSMKLLSLEKQAHSEAVIKCSKLEKAASQIVDLNDKVKSLNEQNADLAGTLKEANADMNGISMKLAVEKQAHNEAVIKCSKLEKAASQIVDLDDKVKSLMNQQNADLASKLESANTSMNGMSMKLLSLEKQAHNEAVIKCSKLEKASSQIVDLEGKVKSLNKQNADLASKLESADASMNGMSMKLAVEKQAHNEAVIKCSKLEKASSRIVELDDKVKSLNKQNADLAGTLKEVNADMNDMDMKLAVEKQAHNEAVIKCSKLEKVASRIVELDDKVKSLNEQNADLAGTLKESHTSVNGMRKSLAVEKQAHSEAVIKSSSKLEKVASRIVDLDDKVKSLNKQNADLASKLESAHASMNGMSMKLAVEKQAHNEAVIKSSSKLEKVASRIVDLDDKVKSLNEQNADLASKLESAHASMNGMSKSLSFEKQAHNEVVIKCSKLEKAASQIVELDDKVKSLMNQQNADLASKLESANTSMNGMSKSLLFEKQAHSEAVIKCMDLRSLVKQAHNDAVIKCSKLEKASLRIVDLDDKVESLNKQNTELGGKLVAADAIMNGMSEKFSVEKHSHNEAVIKCSKFEKEIADYKIAAKLVDKLCKTLEHEQKAHSAAVAMSLDLEKKLATMKSIDKHSDGYRAFATKAESRLLDSNDDRKKRRREETDCDAYFHLQQRHLSNEDDFEYISDEVARERIEELKRLVSLYEAKLLKSETSQSDCVDSGFIADKGGGSSAHGQASAETIDILAVSVKPSQPPCNDIKGEDPQPFRYEYGRVVITIDSDSDSD
jgi:chromosome segregation ATPase